MPDVFTGQFPEIGAVLQQFASTPFATHFALLEEDEVHLVLREHEEGRERMRYHHDSSFRVGQIGDSVDEIVFGEFIEPACRLV